MVLRYLSAYVRHHLAQVRAPYEASFQFLDDDQLLTFVGINRKRRATIRP
jgi:hypothetical protein